MKLFNIDPPLAPFNYVPVGIFTAAFVLIGVGVFALIGRMSRSPRRVFTWVAVIALIISCIPNILAIVTPGGLQMPGNTIDAAAGALLILFHILGAAVAVYALTHYGLEPAAQ
jgi:hypothetical protein